MQPIKFINTVIAAALFCCTVCGCKQEKKAKTSAGPAKKKIITVPAGAAIFYNGKEIGQTPYVLKAKPKSYTIRLIKHGYKPRFAYFTVKKGKNSPETFKLEPASSSVLIDSVPQKAYVIRDGKNLGETPIVLSDLAFGSYAVKLQKSGYSSKDVFFKVDSERPSKITTALESNIGSIYIGSNPRGARIYHNNKNIGITPFNGEFPDGTHEFTLRYNNYATVTAKVTIQKGKRISLHRNLNLLPGSFYITSTPSKARVTFNGKYMGMTPISLRDIQSNVNHNISVTYSGFSTQTLSRKTSPGRQEPIHFNLKRNRGDLELVVNPPGVTVYIDNIKRGVSQKSESEKMAKVMVIKNLTPGEHTLRYAHRRARPASKSRKIKIVAGEVTRLEPLSLWIPNAEIIYTDDSVEPVIILSRNKDGVFVEPYNGIRYTVLFSNIKKINYFKNKE